MKQELTKRDLKRLNGIDSVLIAILVESVRFSPYPIGIPQHAGLRTAAEQNMLYINRKSQRDGYFKKSFHQSGRAFDYYVIIDGKPSWDRDALEKVAKHIIHVGKSLYGITLVWGGDWDGDGVRVDEDQDENFFDGGHIQY